MTVPSSKSLSINAACSVQYGCSRLVFPALQAGPGEKKIAKVFFIAVLSALCIRVYFTSISEPAGEPIKLRFSDAYRLLDTLSVPACSSKSLLQRAQTVTAGFV